MTSLGITRRKSNATAATPGLTALQRKGSLSVNQPTIINNTPASLSASLSSSAPSASLTNTTATLPENPNSVKPLFKRCIDLIATLYSFPLFEFYLFPDGIENYLVQSSDDSLPTIAEPVEVLWHTFKLGAPLCVIYNELAATVNGAFLSPSDVSHLIVGTYPTKPCKENVYQFLTACAEMGIPLSKELSGISELYKDNTSGFMKFLKLVEDLIHRIELADNMPPLKQLPFSTELLKEISNPLDNRARVIKEIVETERAYLFALEELQNYEHELTSARVFSLEMVNILFSNLDELLDFQRRFMVGMESTLNLGVVEQRIGQLFILNEEAFGVYFPFCRNYQNASNFALSQAEDLKLLGHIIQPHHIQSYLIKPVQRLMKYPMLLNELIKLTDPVTYPYTDELKDGYESIKRVTEKLNEFRRQDENERNRMDLAEKMDNWKGFNIDDFGALLLTDKFVVASNNQEKEYYLFLFERILLCCKKDTRVRQSSNRKKSNAGNLQNDSYVYILRGNIYMTSILRVENASDPEFGLFSIRVYWRDTNDPETVCFTLKCRNEELQTLWIQRLEKQIELQKFRKNSAPSMSPFQQSVMSGYGFTPSLSGSSISSYGNSMTRSFSSGQYNGYGMSPGMSPISPSINFNPSMRQNSFDQHSFDSRGSFDHSIMRSSFDQPQYQYIDNGIMQSPRRPSQDRPRLAMQFGYGPVPPMPAMARANSIAGLQQQHRNSRAVSKGREALNALASMASSGLPIAGFSDDEGDDDDDDDDDIHLASELTAYQLRHDLDISRRFQDPNMIGRKMSNGMINTTVRRLSNEHINGHQARRESLSPRSSPQPAAMLAQMGYQRIAGTDTLVNPQFQFPTPPKSGSPQNSQYPQVQQNRRPSQQSPLPTGAENGVPVRRSATNRPSSPSIKSGTPQMSSFIKIRTHYDGEVLIIAMPMRGATINELRSRIDRKVKMMPHKPMLSNPIQLAWKEEIDGPTGKDWQDIKVLETDDDVGQAFANGTVTGIQMAKKFGKKFGKKKYLNEIMSSNYTDQRIQLLAEILETERSYVASLQLLQEYQNNLIAIAPSIRDLNPTFVLDIFSNLDGLVEFQQQFLVEMEYILAKDPSKQRIGFLFVKHGHDFEVYYPFCKNYLNASDIILRHSEDLKILDDVINYQMLPSFLIKPLQRLLKYPLLIRELLKLSPEDDDLRRGLDTIRQVSETLNEMQRKIENERLKTEFIKNIKDWKGNEMDPTNFGDLYLMEEFLIGSSWESERNFHMLLFEKVLICAKRDFTKLRSEIADSDSSRSHPYSYVIYVSILLRNISRVENTSEPTAGVYSLCLNWQDERESEMAKFNVKCMNFEKFTLWKSRIEKQAQLQKELWVIEKMQNQRIKHVQQHKEYEQQQQQRLYRNNCATTRVPETSQFKAITTNPGSQMPRSKSNPHIVKDHSNRLVIRLYNSYSEDTPISPPEMPSFPPKFQRLPRTSSNGSAHSASIQRLQYPQIIPTEQFHQGYGGIKLDITTQLPFRARFPSDHSQSYLQSNTRRPSQVSTNSPVTSNNSFETLLTPGQSNFSLAHRTDPSILSTARVSPAATFDSQSSSPPTPTLPSFVKIRVCYGVDSFILVMPARQATFQELNTRIDRKIKQLELNVYYSHLIQREEVSVGGVSGWLEKGEVFTDADVTRLVASSGGMIELLIC
ncbi:hypothetical protein HK100_007786 [Physocladia obscura]|uniref:Uncharacterized protein n=1 Tax=Physocladia obscura TaxID=109957 RepID=A0AAD5XI94_9FUNG|nr:hypothetical protein HK100_007786 [Physocladia obscura]